MKRREFITFLGGAAAAWPLLAHAQQTVGKVYKIGYLQTSTRVQQLHLIKAFEDGLRALGYRVGDNLVIEYRFAEANLERLPELAAELVRTRCGYYCHRTQCEHRCRIEGNHNDSDCDGKQRRSGRCRTDRELGAARRQRHGPKTQDAGDEIYGKRLELLKEAVPTISRVVILFNPDFTPNLDRLALWR